MEKTLLLITNCGLFLPNERGDEAAVYYASGHPDRRMSELSSVIACTSK